MAGGAKAPPPPKQPEPIPEVDDELAERAEKKRRARAGKRSGRDSTILNLNHSVLGG